MTTPTPANPTTSNTEAHDLPSSPRRRRPGLAAGLSIGLLGGAAAGLVIGVPGLGSAATDPVAPAAVAQVEPTTDEPAADDTTTDDRSDERTSRVRDMLQELVDAGTIDAAQADAVAEHIVSNAPERRGGHGLGRRHRNFHIAEVVTELLGIDAETLRAEIENGATLADVATANGVSTDDLVDALVASIAGRLDDAVENGRIEADKAAERLAELEARVTERVTTARD